MLRSSLVDIINFRNAGHFFRKQDIDWYVSQVK